MNKVDMRQPFLLVLMLLLLFSGVKAQTYADKSYYLVDSLVLSELVEEDSLLVDSCLKNFYATSEDTTKLFWITDIIDLCWSDDLVMKYNNYLKIITDSLLEGGGSGKEYDRIMSYRGMCLGNNGYLFDVEGESDSALFYFEEAYQIYSTLGLKEHMAVELARMSVLYENKGNTTLAIEKCIASNELLEPGQNEYIQARNYRTIADILRINKSYEEAAEYYDLAVKHGVIDGDFGFLGYIYNHKAILATDLKNHDLALRYCDTAIIYFEKVYYPQGIGYTYSNYASLYKILGQMQLSYDYSLKGLEIAKELGHSQLTHISLNDMAAVELEFNNIASAKKYAEEARNYIPITNNKEHTRSTLEVLSDVYSADKNYEKAFAFQKELLELKDSIYSDEKTQDALRYSFDIEYKNQKKLDDLETQQKLELADAEKKRTRLGLFAAALIALIIAIAAYYIYGRLKIIERQKVKLDAAYIQLEEQKKNELAVSNLKALQSQMNPHFIFNALNSVQDLVLLQDIRNSNKYLGKFSDLIRKILLSSKEQFITLAEEIEILELYLDLEKLRFGEEFHIDFQSSVPEMEQHKIELPAMFIQPYIENAIKHGLFHKSGTKHLRVHFSIKENKLQCVVEDNGIGQVQAAIFKEKRLHLHTGFSTEAINERIKLLNETLSEKIELQIEDLYDKEQAAGTKITLKFPF